MSGNAWKAAIGLLFFLSIPSFTLWVIVTALRTGVVPGRLTTPMARSEYPAFYWLILAAYCVVFGMSTYFLGTIALDLWREGP